jgi:hypothetical protein
MYYMAIYVHARSAYIKTTLFSAQSFTFLLDFTRCSGTRPRNVVTVNTQLPSDGTLQIRQNVNIYFALEVLFFGARVHKRGRSTPLVDEHHRIKSSIFITLWLPNHVSIHHFPASPLQTLNHMLLESFRTPTCTRGNYVVLRRSLDTSCPPTPRQVPSHSPNSQHH